MSVSSKVLVASFAAALIGAGTLGFAQPEVPKTPKLPKLPDAPKLPDVPKLPDMPAMPDMKAMEEAWAKAATPGDMHALLAKSVGVWDGKVKLWMVPGMPASESACVTTIVTILGGRYTQATTVGEFDMGGQKFPFEGMGIYGYNNVTKKFESTWYDTMGTGTMRGVGDISADMKVVTRLSTAVDAMTGKEMTMREVETFKDDNTTMLEMYGPSPIDGKEFKTMEIVYTRRAVK